MPFLEWSKEWAQVLTLIATTIGITIAAFLAVRIYRWSRRDELELSRRVQMSEISAWAVKVSCLIAEYKWPSITEVKGNVEYRNKWKRALAEFTDKLNGEHKRGIALISSLEGVNKEHELVLNEYLRKVRESREHFESEHRSIPEKEVFTNSDAKRIVENILNLQNDLNMVLQKILVLNLAMSITKAPKTSGSKKKR